MSKTASHDLFYLVRSLNQAEKRYFKVYASTHVIGEKNSYEVLFDALNRQEHYNEAAILSQYPQLDTGHFHKFKKYLYDLILESLDVYHAQDSADTKIKRRLRAGALLNNKGLFRQSIKMFESAEKMAEEADKPLLQLEAIYSIIAAETRTGGSGHTFSDLDRYLEKQVRLLNVYQNYCEYVVLRKKMFILSNEELSARSAKVIAKAHSLMKHELLQSEDKALSFASKNLYHTIHLNYAVMEGNDKESHRYGLKNVQLYEQNPKNIAVRPVTYLTALINLADIQIRKGDHTAALASAEKVSRIGSSVPAKSLSDTTLSMISFGTLMIRGTVANSTGNFHEAQPLIRQFHDELSHGLSRANMNFTVNLRFMLAKLYFGQEKYRESLNQLNLILNDPKAAYVQDINIHSRILFLINQFELERRDMLEYAVRSAYRFLLKSEKLHRFENALFRFIGNKVPKMITPKDQTDAFRTLHDELSALAKDKKEIKILEYFDYISWLESKISGRPFADIVKEKAASHKR